MTIRDTIKAHVMDYADALCGGDGDPDPDQAAADIMAVVDRHLTPYPALSKAWLHTMVDMIVSEERGTPGLTADQAKVEIDAAIAALKAEGGS